MKLRLSFFSICAMLLFAGALFTSCTQTNTPGTPNTAYTDVWRDVTGLTNGTSYQFSVTGASSGTVITGVSSWTSGTVRVFWSRAVGDTSNVTVNSPSGSTSGSGVIVWAPAVGTSMLRLYETADATAGHPSGLILGNPSSTASITGASKGNIDLVLATDNSLSFPFLSVQAPDQGTISGGRATDFSSTAKAVIGGLAMNHVSADLSTIIPSGSSSIGFYDASAWANITDGSSIVLAVRTADNHYARVEIVPQTAFSNHVWGDTDPAHPATSRRYMDVNVSYQTTTGLGFAGRPDVIRRGTNTHRLRGGPVEFQK